MGVRFLESFITKYVDQGVNTVDILKEIKKFRESKGQRPLIVIDLIGFGHTWLEPEDVIFGIRVKPFVAKAREFFSKLRENGARITFMMDSRLTTTHADQWMKRYDDKYQDQIKIIDEIAKETPVSVLVHDIIPKCNHGQMNLPTVMDAMTKGLGVFIHVTEDHDYDLVVSSYAVDNDAMAIVANDSDYLIHDGDWRYWSISKISPEKMTTLEYDKRNLLKALRLKASQMPLFATLSGNVYFKYEDLYNCHKELAKKYKTNDRAMNIAEFVRKYLLVSADMSENKVKYVVKEIVFNKEEGWETHVADFQASLDSYDRKKYLDSKMKAEVSREPFIKKLLDADYNYIAMVLEGIIARVSVQFDDLRNYKYSE